MLRANVQQIGDVNEKASFTLTVALTDSHGTPENPTTLEWKLCCLETEQTLQDWTSITPTLGYDPLGTLDSVTGSISISGTLNQMRTSSLAKERKALIVAADRDVTEWNSELRYNVVRLGARS